mmetsp:Transcript_2081/g.4054  ORF Transcript_2081/g.4054 Transcript_2081/m.4054 type:complete len:208 (-) Transcript_2081:1681-2304(-)
MTFNRDRIGGRTTRRSSPQRWRIIASFRRFAFDIHDIIINAAATASRIVQMKGRCNLPAQHFVIARAMQATVAFFGKIHQQDFLVHLGKSLGYTLNGRHRGVVYHQSILKVNDNHGRIFGNIEHVDKFAYTGKENGTFDFDVFYVMFYAIDDHGFLFDICIHMGPGIPSVYQRRKYNTHGNGHGKIEKDGNQRHCQNRNRIRKPSVS